MTSLFVFVIIVALLCPLAAANPFCNFTDDTARPSTIIFSLASWGFTNNSATDNLGQSIADAAYAGVLRQLVVNSINETSTTAAAGDNSTSSTTTSRLVQEVAGHCGISAGVITIGNNFPPVGISSSTDDRWKWAYEDCFRSKIGTAPSSSSSSLFDVAVISPPRTPVDNMTWIAALGQEDFGVPRTIPLLFRNGTSNPAAVLDRHRAQHQIDFSLKQQQSSSHYWNLPSSSHVKDLVLSGTRVTAVLRTIVIDSATMRLDCEFGSTSVPVGGTPFTILQRKLQKQCEDHRKWLLTQLSNAEVNTTVAVTFVVGNDNVAAPVVRGESAVFDAAFDAWLVPVLRTHRVSAYLMAGSNVAALALEKNVTETKWDDGALAYVLNGAGANAWDAPSTNPSVEPTTAAVTTVENASSTTTTTTTTTSSSTTSVTASSSTTATLTTTAAPVITPCTYDSAGSFTRAELVNGTCIRASIANTLEPYFSQVLSDANSSSSSSSSAKEAAESTIDTFLVFAHILHLDKDRNPSSISHCAVNRSGVALFCTAPLGIRRKKVIVQIIPYDKIGIMWACFAFVIVVTGLVAYFIRGKAKIKEAEKKAEAARKKREEKEKAREKKDGGSSSSDDDGGGGGKEDAKKAKADGDAKKKPATVKTSQDDEIPLIEKSGK